MQSLKVGSQSKFGNLATAMLPLTIWLALHGYHGITEDGQIYAFQAFAIDHQQLTHDLYLQNTSQDQFTVFSPIYSWFIHCLGLERAARTLTLISTAWFLAATYGFARVMAGRDIAWFAVVAVLITSGDYGGAGVFQVLDPYLTARLPSEALVIWALFCQARGMRTLGLLLGTVAFFLHPLMALPGLLTLVCLRFHMRTAVLGAIGGVLATLVLALFALNGPAAWHAKAIMDSQWLGIVQERSQFLFLQLWSIRDWAVNARPFMFLAITAWSLPDERIRRVCFAAALVGLSGVAVSFIGCLAGPVALLVQGQPWRWVWIAAFISAVLAPLTLVHVWRAGKWGPLCGLLMLCGWILPPIQGTACVTAGMFLWLTRDHLESLPKSSIRWAFAAAAAAIGIWLLATCCSMSWNLRYAPEASRAAQTHDILALRALAIALGGLVLWGSRKAPAIAAFCAVILGAISLLIFPSAFLQARTLNSAQESREFEDWKSAIPATATVLVTPARDVGAFVWFTLERPNYLALDQSSGVVFSRTTSLEVLRRSEVLLPLMEPDWKIRTHLRAAGARSKQPSTRPLTPESLVAVCRDARLGFVVSPEFVGFDPLRHDHAGAWKDWNLYDCRKVRSASPKT